MSGRFQNYSCTDPTRWNEKLLVPIDVSLFTAALKIKKKEGILVHRGYLSSLGLKNDGSCPGLLLQVLSGGVRRCLEMLPHMQGKLSDPRLLQKGVVVASHLAHLDRMSAIAGPAHGFLPKKIR